MANIPFQINDTKSDTFEYLIGNSKDELPLQQPRKIDILQLYFSFSKNTPEVRKITSIVESIENNYLRNGVNCKGSETIRIKTKRLVKSCKEFIAKRKVCGKSASERQKQEKFHRSIYNSFDVADNSTADSSSLEFSDSFSSQESVMPNSSDDYQTDQNSETQSDHDSEPDNDDPSDDPHDDDPDYEPDEFCGIKKKIPIPSTLLKDVSESRASFRISESLLNIGVKIAGANPKSYSISKSSLWKKITDLRQSQKESLLAALSADTTKIIVQFDGKKCSLLNRRHVGCEERLAILCHTIRGDVSLGFIGTDSKSGLNCATEILKSLAAHNLSHRVVGLVCDTENTNTGRLNGTCALVEFGLENDLLHFMCRHHSKEVMLKDVFVVVFGDSQGANITTFDVLVENWDYIRDRNFSYAPIDDEKFEENPLLASMYEEAVNVITDHALSKQIRDDYAELNDLVLKFFGIKTPKPFRVPGATNNARWMARILYAMKTYLFRQHLNLDLDFEDSLERFCMFTALIYTKHWNRCSNAVDAAYNDLELWKELDEYREIDIEIANAALRAHQRHLWYLSDELVVMSLFSEKVSNAVKWNMSTQMARHVEERTENSIKYTEAIDDIQNYELHNFISPRSLFLFERLDLDFEFLDDHPDEWNEMESFKRAKQTILDIVTVVNDSAERAVQLGANAIADKRVQSEKRLQDFVISSYGNKCTI